MADPIAIRMGGYGPPTTGFSRALKRIGDQLQAEFGSGVEIKYAWNIMDLGALGDVLARKIEERVNFRVLGWFENGFRHISNRLREVRAPAHLAGQRIRVLPSKVQARTFELLGALPMPMDLTQAIAMITAGSIDAQENPLSNTVTYGVHKFHRFHTLSNHFYVSRPIFLHRASFDGWPGDLRRAMQKAIREAVAFQRDLHVQEEEEARKVIEAQGCEIVELTAAEHDAFAAAVMPLITEARATFGSELFDLTAVGAA